MQAKGIGMQRMDGAGDAQSIKREHDEKCPPRAGVYDSQQACVSKLFRAMPACFLMSMSPALKQGFSDAVDRREWKQYAKENSIVLNIDMPSHVRGLLDADVDFYEFEAFWQESQAGVCAVDPKRIMPCADAKTWAEHIARFASNCELFKRKRIESYQDRIDDYIKQGVGRWTQ